ncbi:MAG TPA: PA14 domain-containing protein, partial [Methylomirabilota bacterium]|nr:PA14 domain-containing protein [Methylomirabilota bacterium]
VADLVARPTLVVADVGGSPVATSLRRVGAARLARRLAERGILSPVELAERALVGVDVAAEARRLGLSERQAAALYQAAVAALPAEVRADLELAVRHPKATGNIGPDDPGYRDFVRRHGLDKVRPIARERLAVWLGVRDIVALLPRGPLAAVDHRPKLGDARDQGGRPTCTAFCATAVAEAMEFLRDPRLPPRDLAEELMFWYSKGGQTYTGGGYDGSVALRHYGEYGASEERYVPYSGQQLYSNHGHVPAPDAAMDRAQFYRQSPVEYLPARDVAAVKDALRSGRCVGFASDVHGWNTGAGTVSFPDPLDAFGPGASHCTTIIGFIDRDDLPAVAEGGYFIVRNSWGGAGSSAHLMGPEYGGHLLMPYGYYRRYTWHAYVLADPDRSLPEGRRWRAEFYSNPSLRGRPMLVQYLDEVDFDWGTGSFWRIELPFVTVDLGPRDNFSARFTQVRRLRPGWYRFQVRGDDGVRLWVDDELVINAWKDQPVRTYAADHYVRGGDTVLRIEYYERRVLARVAFDMTPRWFHYELFLGDAFTGAPAASFDDTMTDLEWRHAPPVGTFSSSGRFLLRGRGRVRFAAGEYRFHARHTGGCRIWVGRRLVLDDWDGTSPTGAPVLLTSGLKRIRVEFRNLATLPGPGVRGYYRAALAFEWSQTEWHAALHDDQGRKAISDASLSHPDVRYEMYRTEALAGDPVFTHRYPVPPPAGTTYGAADAPLQLGFSSLDAFTDGIAGTGAVPDDWLGVHLRRRVFLPEGGRWVLRLQADDGYRVVVDGRAVLQQTHGIGPDPFEADVDLAAGVHDVSIEYANTMWGGLVAFSLTRAWWTVSYYSGRSFDTFRETRLVDRVDRILAERPASVGGANYSVRAQRSLWRPLGRYRVVARADDGIRVKLDGRPLIDAWKDQAATGYTAFVEHNGGPLALEIEYYQGGGGAALDLELVPDGFLGEYYRGTELQQPDPGSGLDRTVPNAYRFEPVIDFDWGATGHLSRIGADLFSARWRGPLELPVGRWRFEVTADDGVRLLLDGRLLVDQWHDQGPTTHGAEIDLVGGEHFLELEYYERRGGAVCRLAVRRQF